MNKKKNEQSVEEVFPEVVEKRFKLLMRILSWVVGVAFVMVILLPEFNKPVLDQITRIFYLLGISCLLLFLVLEFFAPNLKRWMAKLIDE